MPVADNHAPTAHVKVTIQCKKRPGQFLLRQDPVVLVNGDARPLSWGYNALDLPAGAATAIEVHFPYMGLPKGRATATVTPSQGRPVDLEYIAPSVITLSGTLREVQHALLEPASTTAAGAVVERGPHADGLNRGIQWWLIGGAVVALLALLVSMANR